MYRILIACSDSALVTGLINNEVLKANNLIISGVTDNVDEAIQMSKSGKFDIAIIDFSDGDTELVKKLSATNPHVCVVIISSVTDFSKVRECFRRGAFDYLEKPLKDKELEDTVERIISYKEQNTSGNENSFNTADEALVYKEAEKRFTSLILTGSKEIAEEINIIYERAQACSDDIVQIRSVIKNIIVNMNGILFNYFPWLKKIENEPMVKTIEETDTLAELRYKLFDSLASMCSCVRKYELHHTERIVRKTCEYVIEHVEEEIRLDLVAEEVMVSGNYIGKLFKKVTQCNFNDYVTKVKMEYAKGLLGTCKFKSYEVCEKLGYSKPDYFSRLFKQYTGFTPAQFKKMDV